MKSEGNLDRLIGSFRLIIRLRMIGCRSYQGSTQLLKDCLPEGTHEFKIPITNDDYRNFSVVRKQCHQNNICPIFDSHLVESRDKKFLLDELAGDRE